MEDFASSVSVDSDDDWCDQDPACTSSGDFNESNYYIFAAVQAAINVSNTTPSCVIPICPRMLSYTINHTSVRVYDLILLFFSVVFLLFLIIRLMPTVKKLHGSVPLFRLFYILIFLIPIVSCIYEVTSLSTSYQDTSSKLTHVLLRGSILMTELSVVIFGLFIKLCGNSIIKLTASILAIASITVLFTVAEGVLEFFNPHHLPCENYKFFTHGGMIFLFSTSILFAIAYATIFFIFIVGLYEHFNLPTKKSFYRYALFLSFVNITQAIGSFLWFTGKHRPASGNAGICITLATNAIYVVTFAPVVYWIFLSNYFRMNSVLKSSSDDRTNINVGEEDMDASRNKKKNRGGSNSSNPLAIGRNKRSVFADTQVLVDNSYGSSSSYGSMDEEAFARKDTPDDFK